MAESAGPRKRSLGISGHRTSVSLEDAFWDALKDVAQAEGKSRTALAAEIDSRRGELGLSSAVRLHVLAHFRARAS